MPPLNQGHRRLALQILRSIALGLASVACPNQGEKMSKPLGGIIDCKYKTSWHLNGFPYGSNIGSTVYYIGSRIGSVSMKEMFKSGRMCRNDDGNCPITIPTVHYK